MIFEIIRENHVNKLKININRICGSLWMHQCIGSNHGCAFNIIVSSGARHPYTCAVRIDGPVRMQYFISSQSRAQNDTDLKNAFHSFVETRRRAHFLNFNGKWQILQENLKWNIYFVVLDFPFIFELIWHEVNAERRSQLHFALKSYNCQSYLLFGVASMSTCGDCGFWLIAIERAPAHKLFIICIT